MPMPTSPNSPSAGETWTQMYTSSVKSTRLVWVCPSADCAISPPSSESTPINASENLDSFVYVSSMHLVSFFAKSAEELMVTGRNCNSPWHSSSNDSVGFCITARSQTKFAAVSSSAA
eukprot:1286273-Rhodomonas_salina.1